MGFFQTEIGGNPVAGLQQHRITRNQVRGIQLVLATGPQNPGFGRKHVANGRQGLFSLSFLDKAHQGLNNDHGRNHPGIHPLAQAGRNHRSRCQHIDQKIPELPAQPRPWPLRARFRQRIGAIADEAITGFLVRQG